MTKEEATAVGEVFQRAHRGEYNRYSVYSARIEPNLIEIVKALRTAGNFGLLEAKSLADGFLKEVRTCPHCSGTGKVTVTRTENF